MVFPLFNLVESESETGQCSGVLVGDFIRSINGVPVFGLTQSAILKLFLDGEPNSSVLVVVEQESGEQKGKTESHFLRVAEGSSWNDWMDSNGSSSSNADVPLSRFLWVYHDCSLHLEPPLKIEQPNMEQLQRMPIKQCGADDLRKAVLLRNAEKTLMKPVESKVSNLPQSELVRLSDTENEATSPPRVLKLVGAPASSESSPPPLKASSGPMPSRTSLTGGLGSHQTENSTVSSGRSVASRNDVSVKLDDIFIDPAPTAPRTSPQARKYR